MADKHFGFQLFWNNHEYFMPSDRKKITDTVAEIFAGEHFLRIGKYSKWSNATPSDRAEVIKRFKYAIQPCVFEINGTCPGKMYLFYRTLRHAQDENSSCGGGTIPEKYWGDEVTIFFEEDVTIYLDESEVCE